MGLIIHEKKAFLFNEASSKQRVVAAALFIVPLTVSLVVQDHPKNKSMVHFCSRFQKTGLIPKISKI